MGLGMEVSSSVSIFLIDLVGKGSIGETHYCLHP
jgi:hypothetical protein